MLSYFMTKGNESTKMKPLIFSITLLIVFALVSCSRTEKSDAPASGGDASARPAGNTPPKVISGRLYPDKPKADKQLVAQYDGRDEDGDYIKYTFRWHVDNEIVQEGPLGALDPGKYRKGSEVFVEIIPTDTYGPGTAFKTETVVIGNQPPVITSVKLEPADPTLGSIVTAVTKGSDPDGDDVRYTYQWFVNGKAATEEPQESSQFSTQGFRKKDRIHAMVTPFDRDGAGAPKVSNSLVLVNRAPQITSAPPTDLAGGVYLYQVAAKDPDGDKLTYSLLKAPQGMTIDPSTGLIRWELPKEVQAKTDVPIKISVDDGDGGKALQEFSLTVEMK